MLSAQVARAPPHACDERARSLMWRRVQTTWRQNAPTPAREATTRKIDAVSRRQLERSQTLRRGALVADRMNDRLAQELLAEVARAN
jgi:hypothetical protein